MKSHLKDFEQSNSMAHKTSWLVGAIELVKKYNGRDSVFYHTLSANDFYIQASSIEDKTVIRDKLDQKEKFIKLTFEQAIKHIEENGLNSNFNEMDKMIPEKSNFLSSKSNLELWQLLIPVAIFLLGAGFAAGYYWNIIISYWHDTPPPQSLFYK